MKKARIIVAVVGVAMLYLTPCIALKCEMAEHRETRKKLEAEEKQSDEAWMLVQELRATVAALQ